MSEKKSKRNKVVSFSQYSMFHSCQKKYKLQYIDKLAKGGSNIHSIFGVACHETIQDFLRTMYGESKKAALSIDLDDLLYKKLIETFQDAQKKMNGNIPCTRNELIEFYEDGRNILQYFRGKLNKFYPKQGYELVDIEYKLEVEVKPGVVFWGYIDVVLRDKISGKDIVIDLKTSTKGWSSYQKNDKTKTDQVLLYKKLYSDEKDIELNSITVEYQILKRKVEQSPDLPYHIPRISKFIPPNGKPSINKAWASFMSFVDHVYDDNGKVRENSVYLPNPTRLCDWCDFKTLGICNSWKCLCNQAV